MADILLSVKNLSKQFDNIHGISSISFDIHAKEIVALVGPNGSGKTTTLKTILMLLKKDAGTINMFGKDINSYYEDIMQYVGYLQAENVDYYNLTAKAYFKYANKYYGLDYTENYLKLANEFNLDLDSKISNLSTGELKKIGIINALFHEPKIIILDEPTANLDPSCVNTLYNELKKRAKDGACVLFTGNNLTEVKKICNRALFINKGTIIKDLEIDELSTLHKKVTIVCSEEINEKKLKIDNIIDLKIENDKATFLYVGQMNPLIRKLKDLDIIDITIESPSLDELFIKYFK